jgi:hypothetical protein
MVTGSLHPGNVLLQNTTGTTKSAMEEIQRLLAQQQGQAGVRSTGHEDHFSPASLALYNSQPSSAEHSTLHSPLHTAGMQPMPSAAWPSSSRMGVNDLHSSPQFNHYHPSIPTAAHEGVPTLASLPMLSSAAHHIHGSPLSSSMSMLTDSASNSPYLSSNLAMMNNANPLTSSNVLHSGPSSLVSPMAFHHVGQRTEGMGSNLRSTPPITTSTLASRPAPAVRTSTIGGSIAGTTRRTKFRRSRTGCMVCRKRKVRCDQDGVPCKQCRIGKRDCHYEDNPPKRKRKGKSATRSGSTDEREMAKLDVRNSSCDTVDGSENNSGEEGGRISSSSSDHAHIPSAPSHLDQEGTIGQRERQDISSSLGMPLATSSDPGAASEQWASSISTFGLFNPTNSDDWAITTPSTGPTSVHTADGDGVDSSTSSRRVTLTLDGHADVAGASHKPVKVLEEGESTSSDFKGLIVDADSDPGAHEGEPSLANETLTTSLIDASHYAVPPHSS